MSTLITDSNELTHFTAVFSERDLVADLAPRLSCIEVEALAGLLRALGEPATADTWIRDHATDDELGDAHYQGDTRIPGPDRPAGGPAVQQLPVTTREPTPTTVWARFM